MKRTHSKSWWSEPWLWVIIATIIVGITGIFSTAIITSHNSNSQRTSLFKNKPKKIFNGKKVKTPNLIIKINKTYVKPAEEKKGEYFLVFNYSVHNINAKNINANEAFVQTFRAYQPNKNTDNQLDTGIVDQSNIQYQRIKKGGTVQAKYAVVIKNKHKPVTLKAYDSDDNCIGQHKYKFRIKKKHLNVKRNYDPNQSSMASGTSTNSSSDKSAPSDKHPNGNKDSSDNSDSDNPDYKGEMFKNTTDKEKQDYIDWQVKWQNMSEQERQAYDDSMYSKNNNQ